MGIKKLRASFLYECQKEMSLMSQRADFQLGVPRAKCGCLAVLSVTSTINAAQIGKAVAYGAEITQKPFNYIAATRSFMDAFRHELESFQCLFCQRRPVHST
jgi:hypothetical protein